MLCWLLCAVIAADRTVRPRPARQVPRWCVRSIPKSTKQVPCYFRDVFVLIETAHLPFAAEFVPLRDLYLVVVKLHLSTVARARVGLWANQALQTRAHRIESTSD